MLIAQPESNADFNNDGQVNFADFLILSNNFGEEGMPGDANNDNVVNFADFLLLREQFGTSV